MGERVNLEKSRCHPRKVGELEGLRISTGEDIMLTDLVTTGQFPVVEKAFHAKPKNERCM